MANNPEMTKAEIVKHSFTGFISVVGHIFEQVDKKFK